MNTINQMISHQFRISADRAAIIDADRTISYAELGHRVAVVAAHLVSGRNPGSVTAVAAPRGIDGVVALLATWWAGQTYLAIDLAQPVTRLREILEVSQADLLLVPDGEPPSWSGETPVAPIQPPGDSRGIAAQDCADIAYLVFTSGSTGSPKAIEMPEAAIRGLARWHLGQEPQHGVRTALLAAVGFDVAIQEVLATLVCGGTLVVVDDVIRRDPAALLTAVDRHGIHRLFLPTALLQPLADQAQRSGGGGTLRDVVCAGDQLRITPAVRQWFARLPGTRLHNHYGPAETHVVTAHVLVGDPAAWPDVAPIGFALPEVRIEIGDETGDGDVTEPGELTIAGNRVARGYLGRPDLTEARFTDVEGQRGYRTGDLAVRIGGVLHFRGRGDRQVKISGYRVELDEIEAKLGQHPGLSEAAVDTKSAYGGIDLVAYVVPDPAAEAATARQVREFLAGTLPPYMVPARIHVLDEIPLTVNGKLDRKRAAELVRRDRPLAPGAETKSQVRAAFEAVLGHDEFADNENFFDIGGTSFRAMQVRELLSEALSRDVPIVLVYENPTAGSLAASLAAERQHVAAGRGMDLQNRRSEQLQRREFRRHQRRV